MVGKTDQTSADIYELRDHIADFDDFFRPLRNYFYWEPHCFDIPVCWSFRSVFDTLDGVDLLSDDLKSLTVDLHRLDELMPQLRTLLPPMIENLKTHENHDAHHVSDAERHAEPDGRDAQNATAMGQAFDASKNDDSFYLPPEVFDNPDFKRGLKMFVSPDGKAIRFIISHEGDPATPEGISHIDAIKNAAFEAIKGTPLEGSKIYLGGTAATYKDMHEGSNYDLLIAGIAAACLIFIIMLIITRSVIAAAVIVGTVLLSLGARSGCPFLSGNTSWVSSCTGWCLRCPSSCCWRSGRTTTCCWCPGSRRNSTPGLNTGIIRAMGGTGGVVTAAGLVFAFTMASFVFSDSAGRSVRSAPPSAWACCSTP